MLSLFFILLNIVLNSDRTLLTYNLIIYFMTKKDPTGKLILLGLIILLLVNLLLLVASKSTYLFSSLIFMGCATFIKGDKAFGFIAKSKSGPKPLSL